MPGHKQNSGLLRGLSHITERITTLGGRTTTAAIEVTGITSIIATAIKAGTGWCEG